jgi:hypothetical protein
VHDGPCEAALGRLLIGLVRAFAQQALHRGSKVLMNTCRPPVDGGCPWACSPWSLLLKPLSGSLVNVLEDNGCDTAVTTASDLHIRQVSGYCCNAAEVLKLPFYRGFIITH